MHSQIYYLFGTINNYSFSQQVNKYSLIPVISVKHKRSECTQLRIVHVRRVEDYFEMRCTHEHWCEIELYWST